MLSALEFNQVKNLGLHQNGSPGLAHGAVDVILNELLLGFIQPWRQ
jgi:hypothetical protein